MLIALRENFHGFDSIEFQDHLKRIWYVKCDQKCVNYDKILYQDAKGPGELNMDLANSTILKVVRFGEPKAVYLQSVFHLK